MQPHALARAVSRVLARRALPAFALACTLALPLAAQAAAPEAAAPAASPAEAGTLIGQVRESLRGVTLAGALVRIGGRQASTDANGQFRIDGLAPGQYTLDIDFLGYRHYSQAVSIGGERATVVNPVLSATNAVELDRVLVRGQRDAQALALNQERASTNYVNVVSADLLGTFPDNNIAESTQRMPGVSIERDQGEGRYVTVRGAPKEYTTVSLDGVPLANPDKASRGVELDTIPSDVISALEVTKALTPDMDGDAIAGNINIRTQSALDRKGPIVRASIAGGRYQLGDGKNQRAAASLGGQFGPDRQLGLLLSGSFSRQGRFTDNVENLFESIGGRYLPTEVQIKDYEGTRTRTGLTGRLDLRIDENNQVYALASLARFEDHEFRDNLIMALDRHTAASNDVTGTARATFDKELRERTYDKRINTYSLGGEHWLGDWRVDWQASRSLADKKTDPRKQYIFRSSVRPNLNYDYTNPDYPVWSIVGRADAPATGLVLPESWFGFRRFNDRFESGSESETGLRVDLRHDQDWLGEDGEIRLGLRSRQRRKSFDDERYRNGSAADFAKLGVTMSDLLCTDLGPSDNFDYFFTGRRFCRDIFARYTGPLINSPNYVRLIPDSISGDYWASEDITAGYARLDARWGKLNMVAGVRYEATRTTGKANQYDVATKAITPVGAQRDYGDVLPSVNLRYALDEDRILRASYTTGINRPNFNETAPYRLLGERASDIDGKLAQDITEGNPAAKEAYSHNFDLSYEHYLRPLGLVSVALFYKRINDPLFLSTRTVETATTRTRYTRPENGSDGSVKGVELAWQQALDFLPAPLDGLGLYANYTYADSDAKLPFGAGRTMLPGTSKHNYNLAVSYEYARFTSRLAYTYRSRFIQSFDVNDRNLNVYWDGRGSLDFSASLGLGRQWRLFTEVNNITDTIQRRFQGSRNRVLEMEGFGRSWLVGIRYEM
ncbi:TonB-dependent receptor [Thermomonas flagellata]|uniref:TonB-dependent receptor n=1 Tax=Thermomonas flagellata TaxID=2888524 RepID=UPI001F036656|nr:TonB-dependent receptor [Thermomonas flagellata]